MSALLERLGVELPVVQAGMAGGIARHELAAAVSDAGGLGTIGLLMNPESLARELAAARSLTGRPVAVNLLLPFASAEHWRVARGADLVVTFWGRPLRRSPGVWLHQCGSLEEALLAKSAGADGVIVQGHEAGGHVRGDDPALQALDHIRSAVGPDYPVWLAGGIASADDVREALAAGADAAVLGTRFVMSDECPAIPAYKQRLVEARETVVTDLFGVGWPSARVRVIWNEACERWLAPDGGVPRWLPPAQRAISIAPRPLLEKLIPHQRPELPLFGPYAPVKGMPKHLLDTGALYAGESVARMHEIRPAGELTRELAG